MDIRGLGYIAIEAADVPAWASFGSQVLGLMAETTATGELLLRADERPYRLRVRPSEDERLDAVGWEVPGSAALDQAADELGRAGVTVRRDPAAAKERRVTGLVSFDAPDGTHHELFWGAELDHVPFISPVGVSGFVMGGLGLGHVVLATESLDAAYQFYTDIMGFRLSDTMTLSGTRVIFLHCNGRHHSLALGEGARSALGHFMLEVASVDDVGYALDRATDQGVRIRQSLGRHTNDQMLSFYAATPSGFSVEYGYGGRVIDDATWTPSETTRGSFWGHRRVPRPAASQPTAAAVSQPTG
jgi:3,4-dihydroxy-9,10-secoandrosta-1,3,5(10)-triene-9,17-dione 4,5-dioxygenase